MRLLGKVARVSVETLLLPVVLVLAIETWFRLADNSDECRCMACGWENRD